MKYKRFGRRSIKQAAYIVVLGLGFSGCATTTDANYAYRNNTDSAQSRCVELARTMGYRDVGVDSIERDGRAEWDVRLVVQKDGKNRKERCGVTPIIWTVTGAKVRAPVWGIFCFQSLLLSKMAFINAL
jgi:hypothetical protein